ncbi:small ribosomal subunit protein mS35 [Halyomorpha halys]|uniref:small ribosomal subunit protein mS35 n=1 Tax=Halyomorpha halys TaxID=286706 RepID=UPI0006D4FE96|nr:28S ribosomal protein S35, mitochondrial [Halyomorpha halys]
MSTAVYSCYKKSVLFKCKKPFLSFYVTRKSTDLASKLGSDEDEFRTLDIRGGKTARTSSRKKQVRVIFPPRTEKMPIDQDWTNVWPGPRTFHPASVPLPLRQGINKLGASPGKVGNVELMKIPNFLHLTPPAIKKHCMALKQFCTPWPKALNTNEDCKNYFPVEVIQTDYCHSSPSIRNPLARIITIKFSLDKLHLDEHARDKFLRLVGDRYDEETGIVTIVTDKCPLRKQNYDYALYLLTAVYYESWTFEPWETEKSQPDLEYYDWNNSKCKENITYLFKQINKNIEESNLEVDKLKESVVALLDEGENDYNLKRYKEAVLDILFPGCS